MAIGSFQKVIMRLSYVFCLWIIISQGWAQEDSKETPERLTLREAILKNLLQQPAIRVALYNITIQRGVAQSSAAPFDPVVNASAVHTYSRNLINPPLTFPSSLQALEPTTNALVPGASPFSLISLVTPPTITVPLSNSSLCSTLNSLAYLQSSQAAATTANNTTAPTTTTVTTILPTNLQSHETNAHLDVSKLTRYGTLVIFSLDVDQIKDPLDSPSRIGAATATLGMIQPCLRGFKDNLARMTELANLQELSAIKLDTLQTISQQVFTTVGTYWDVVANKEIVEIQKASEKRLEDIVESVKTLIKREQLAEADILQPIAQLATQIAARVNAEQTYYASTQQLKFLIGEFDEVSYCKENDFLAVDKFAEFSFISPAESMVSICKLFPLAFHRRFDILASSTREGESVLLLKGAQNLELPRLDVIGRASWTDFKKNRQAEGFFNTLDFDKPQLDLSIGVIFSTPFYQDEARGLIRQRQGQWAQFQARTQLLKQQAMSDINTALKNHIALLIELKKSKEAAEEYGQLVKNEKKKLVAGYGNIFYLLSYEATLTAAQASYVNFERFVAQNIANIRFLTGTLIQASPPENCESFLVEDATTLPF